MEEKEYVVKLPLQQMVLRKIAIILWNRFIMDSKTPSNETLEFQVENVQEKVPLLFLPSSLGEKLMNAIIPIGVEIQRWRDYHASLVPLKAFKKAFDQFCWTSQGTVDYRKTAEILIRMGKLNTVNSYELSCLCCLDDDIRNFWGKLHERIKKSYASYRERTCFTEFYFEESVYERKSARLVTFWTHFLKGDTDLFISKFRDESRRTFNQLAFESAALSGNKVATEYFFQKLTFQEREESLVEIAQFVLTKRCQQNIPYRLVQHLGNVGIYLISQMSKEEQKEVWQNKAFETMVCFLDCPYQDLFMKFAERLTPLLSFYEYRGLLTLLSNNKDITTFNFGKMFLEFFRQTPIDYRNIFFMDSSFEEDMNWYFKYPYYPLSKALTTLNKLLWFENLFKRNNLESIKQLLRYITSAEKEALIFGQMGARLCAKLVREEKWILLKLFVEECDVTKDDRKRLKDCFRECLYTGNAFAYDRNKVICRRNFSLFIDNLDVQVSEKKRIEEVEGKQPASAKKKPQRKRYRNN